MFKNEQDVASSMLLRAAEDEQWRALIAHASIMTPYGP